MTDGNSRNFGSRSDLFYLRPCVRLFLFAHSSIIIRERITGGGIRVVQDQELWVARLRHLCLWPLTLTPYFIPPSPLPPSRCLYMYMDPPSIAIVLDSGDINGRAEPVQPPLPIVQLAQTSFCSQFLSDVIGTNHQMIPLQWPALMAL